MSQLAISVETIDLTTTDDAERWVDDVKSGIEQAKEALYQLWLGGWQLLYDSSGNSYSSFHAMLDDRFKGRSTSYLYRLKDIRVVEIELSEKQEQPVTLKDAHVRELKKLKSTDQRVSAIGIARGLAETEGIEEPVARHIEAGVKQVQQKDKIENSPHHVIRNLLNAGKMSFELGVEAVDALNKLSTQAQYDIQALITKYGGISDAKLIPELAIMMNRRFTDKPSLVLEWLEETGDIFDVPFNKATITNLNRAKYEEKQIREAEEKERQRKAAEDAGETFVEEILCTLYKGDPIKTKQILKAMLGSDYMELRAAFVDEWLMGE